MTVHQSFPKSAGMAVRHRLGSAFHALLTETAVWHQRRCRSTVDSVFFQNLGNSWKENIYDITTYHHKNIHDICFFVDWWELKWLYWFRANWNRSQSISSPDGGAHGVLDGRSTVPGQHNLFVKLIQSTMRLMRLGIFCWYMTLDFWGGHSYHIVWKRILICSIKKSEMQ